MIDQQELPWWRQPHAWIAGFVLLMIASHLLMRWIAAIGGTVGFLRVVDIPLVAAIVVGGAPLVLELLNKLRRLEFGADLLAGISIISSAWLGEYLAGAIIVLMLSGGATLEDVALRRAGDALKALAQRVPSVARRRTATGPVSVPLESVQPGDELVVLPHEICPVDGVVLEGRGHMDESYLSGEPYVIPKLPGAAVLSGSLNGEAALVIRCERRAEDSRYAQVQRVMEEGVQRRPRMRRLADQIGGWFTPVALVVALVAWYVSSDPTRFLSVLVIATPCPLLIAIPVAQVGAISRAAKQQILIRDPAVLERLELCRTAIFDKTGTLTTGKPQVTEVVCASPFTQPQVVRFAASLEQYSKHPLASAIHSHAKSLGIEFAETFDVSEPPGSGLSGHVGPHLIQVTGRKLWLQGHPDDESRLPERRLGLECLVAVDGQFAGLIRFRDIPRSESAGLIRHLAPRHGFQKRILLTGDREVEARAVGESLGIELILADKSPEEKLAIVQAETRDAPTLYVGDGINDAPAMTAATVAVAIGSGAVAGQAAGAVLLDGRLERLDQLMHIGRHLRRVAIQSAVGGMVLSGIGMLFAAAGYLTPILGALLQEGIDLFAVLWALRAAGLPNPASDFELTAQAKER